MTGMPSGWSVARLGDVANDIAYGFTTASTMSGVLPKLLRITDIQDGAVNWDNVPRCTDLPDDRVLLSAGDIVIARTGATTGKSYLIDTVPEKAVFASYLIRVRLGGQFEPRYAWAFMQSSDYWSQIQTVSKGTAQPGANATILSELSLPVAPLSEQRRIVAKIDSLASKSRRARDHLDHIPRLVEKYKQAVLAAAFRGDLTREWRAHNVPDRVSRESLEELRKTAWVTLSTRSRYSAADEIDWRPNIDLPTGWMWASVDQLSCLIQYGTSAKTNEDGNGVAVLRMGNLQGGELELTSLKYLPRDHHEFPELLLHSGDILFNRTNSAELVGKSAVYEGEPAQASFASYLIRIRACGLMPRLLCAYINSAVGREWVASVVNQQVGQANVNGTKLRRLGVPVMPPAEQQEVAHRIRTAFAWIDRLASEATSARRLIDRLDQTVLAKAFRGELVPQDPADEPASVLLERIRAERGAAPTPKRGRKTRAGA
ncbi:restriction endonuclease subunit S [Mesorhizobium sp. KR2-14]|uniref:restriction endonuclease subunit S n=1 Tax=Mesorhizobium sp. KR2-14 TaxID=3156610 RepID=UPI0032B5A0C1